MKLFVGSVNTAPDGWNFVSTLDQAKQHLLNETIDELHIEDVIGTEPSGGHRLLFWLKAHIKTSYFILPNSFTVHSAIPELHQQMDSEKNDILLIGAKWQLLEGEGPIWVYLDDTRIPQPGWILTTTPEETIELLQTGRVEKLSLDNDLGLGDDERGRERDGYSVLRWLEEEVEINKFISPTEITVHSGNPVARTRMQMAIDQLERINVMKIQYITDIRWNRHIFPYSSIDNTSQRIKQIIGSATYVRFENEDRGNLHNSLNNFVNGILANLQVIPNTEDNFNDFAKKNIRQIASYLTENGLLKIGLAQKFFNLVMKDMWAWNKLNDAQEKVLHWPIDRGVLAMVRKPAWKAWTKVATTENQFDHTFNEYLGIQKILRSQLHKFPNFNTAIEMEQYFWHKFELINN